MCSNKDYSQIGVVHEVTSCAFYSDLNPLFCCFNCFYPSSRKVSDFISKSVSDSSSIALSCPDTTMVSYSLLTHVPLFSSSLTAEGMASPSLGEESPSDISPHFLTSGHYHTDILRPHHHQNLPIIFVVESSFVAIDHPKQWSAINLV